MFYILKTPFAYNFNIFFCYLILSFDLLTIFSNFQSRPELTDGDLTMIFTVGGASQGVSYLLGNSKIRKYIMYIYIIYNVYQFLNYYGGFSFVCRSIR